MNCGMDQSQLTAYVDHQLVEDEWRRVEAHVEACVHCRQTVRELTRTTEELAHYFEDVIVPFGFEDEVMQSLNAIRQTKHMNRLGVIYIILSGIGMSSFIAFLISPLGTIVAVSFRTLFILAHGLSFFLISLSYGWLAVFTLLSVGLAGTSFLGLHWILRRQNSEVVI